MSLLISNRVDFHYEIIESVMLFFIDLLGITGDIYLQIFSPKRSNLFLDYIMQKYPNLKIHINEPTKYKVDCTFSENNPGQYVDDPNHFFICHEATIRTLTKSNIYYLTPFFGESLYIRCPYLPFSETAVARVRNDSESDTPIISEQQTGCPIYVIQGEFKRRYLPDLLKILQSQFEFPYKIVIISKDTIPLEVKNFRNKVTHYQNLDFVEYHRVFLSAYCLLTLVNKKQNSPYYRNKLTSSINYVLGYKLRVCIDSNLQDIYNLDNAYVYRDDEENSIVGAFEQSLREYYQ